MDAWAATGLATVAGTDSKLPDLKWQRTGDEKLDRNFQQVALAFQGGAVAGPVKRTVIANATLAGNEEFVFVDTSRGVVTISLPSTMKQPVVIKSSTLSANLAYVIVSGTGKIDVAANRVVISPLESRTFVSDGKGWFTV